MYKIKLNHFITLTKSMFWESLVGIYGYISEQYTIKSK